MRNLLLILMLFMSSMIDVGFLHDAQADLGRSGRGTLYFEGDWSNTRTYREGAVVKFTDNKLYVSTRNTTAGESPPNDPWGEFAAGIITGTQGPQGIRGVGYIPVFRRNGTRPPFPTSGNWDGTRITNLDRNWSEFTQNVPGTDPLWMAIGILPSTNGAITWASMVSGQGVRGEKGDPGATGATGPRGPTGQTGAQGTPGTPGTPGQAGPPGPQGRQGIQGPQGLTGPTGPRGPQGQTGAAGADGVNGASFLMMYRKSFTDQYQSPAVTWDGVSLASFAAPNPWQLTPFYSKLDSMVVLDPANTNPTSVAGDEDRVVVLNGNTQVYIYSPTLTRTGVITLPVGVVQGGVAVSGTSIYVVNNGVSPTRVLKYNATTQIRETADEFTIAADPLDVSAHDGKLYTLHASAVNVYDLSDGTRLTAEEFNLPMGVSSPASLYASEYMHVLSGTTVYALTYEGTRVQSRDFTVASGVQKIGGDGTALYGLESSRSIGKYYDVNLPLIASVITLQPPAIVTATVPFEVSGLRGAKGAVGERGPPGMGGTGGGTGGPGTMGVKGDSQRVIFIRSATMPATPTGITFANGRLANLGVWDDDPPPDNGQLLYQQQVEISYATATPTVNTIGTPYQVTFMGPAGPAGPAGGVGPPGAKGDTGDTSRPIYILASSMPPAPTGITINSAGTFQNLTSGSFTWDDDPPGPETSTNKLYKQDLAIDFATDPPTVTTFGTPYRAGKGDDGAAGAQGGAGPAGPAGPAGAKGDKGDKGDTTRPIYIRAMTMPATPSGITVNAAGRFTNLVSGTDTWDDDPPPPSGDLRLYKQDIEINFGTDPPTVTTFGTPYAAGKGDKGDQGDPGAPSGVNTDITEARFRFTPDTTDQIVNSQRAVANPQTPFNRGYQTITAFTGGTAGVATMGSNGIIIPSAGVYSVVALVDIQVRASVNSLTDSEWGLTIHIERQDGTLIDEFIFFDEVIASVLNNDVTISAYGSIPPIPLPANALIQLRVFYRKLSPSGGALMDPFNYRVVTPPEDDDRIVVRRYTQAGNPSGVKGDSQVAIFTRATSTPTAPSGIGLNGTTLTNLGTWQQNGAPSGTDPIWIQWLELDYDTTPATVHLVGTPWELPRGPAGQDGAAGTAGPRGPPGMSEVSVFARNASRPSVPTALVFRQDTTLSIATAGGLTWHRNAFSAAGTTQLWEQRVQLATDVNPPTETWLGSPTPTGQGAPGAAGAAGPRGPEGMAVIPIWALQGPQPAIPTGIRISAGGTWTDLSDQNGITWLSAPQTPTGGIKLWRQLFRVDFSMSPPGLNSIGVPTEEFLRGPQGIQGTAGMGGRGIRAYFMRSTTSARPNRPTITYNGNSFSEPNPDTWIANSIPPGAGAYVWQVLLFYQDGVVGQNVTLPVPFNARNGVSILEIYQRGASAPAAPTLTYNGTSFAGLGTWSRTIPATPTDQNLWAMTATYTAFVSGSVTLDPTPYLKGLAMASAPITPPPVMTESAAITYGILTPSEVPIGAGNQTPAHDFAVGGTYTWNNVPAGPTTADMQYFYMQVPANYTITSIVSGLEGEVLDEWTHRTANNRWVRQIRLSRSADNYAVTVRRDR